MISFYKAVKGRPKFGVKVNSKPPNGTAKNSQIEWRHGKGKAVGCRTASWVQGLRFRTLGFRDVGIRVWGLGIRD